MPARGKTASHSKKEDIKDSIAESDELFCKSSGERLNCDNLIVITSDTEEKTVKEKKIKFIPL
ncbi:hypothetical protein H5U35_09535 [Candidatus Aerophobetes bacterium]|nr:hypothetical protein [Candidatus Aerophobetes bacterium]